MVDLVNRFFPDLRPAQVEKLAALRPLYEDWNAKINVISRKDMVHFDERHVLHSLALSRYWTPKPGQHAIDIGTGGGFPGIPLAILHPEVNFLLVDSIAKKIGVVQEVARALDLTNVRAEQARAEKVRGNFDTALSRAVARLQVLVRYCTSSKMQVKELICLKGGDLSEELEEVDRFPSMVYPLDRWLPLPFFETKKVVKLSF
jgi:16S rRNA (guanine527-N7)-methyltransferase